jgi:hypothetical protein
MDGVDVVITIPEEGVNYSNRIRGSSDAYTISVTKPNAIIKDALIISTPIITA